MYLLQYIIMSRRKIHEEFVQEVEDEVGGEYTVLGEYQGYRTKLKMRHNKCGNEYMVTPQRFLSRGSRCPDCYATTRKTQDEFEQDIKKSGNGEYEVLGEYINSETKVKLKHKKCGYIWETTPNSFLSGGHRCSSCASRKTHDQFVKQIKEKYDGEYKVLSQYVRGDKKIKMKHIPCGTTWMVTPNAILYSSSCPTCGKRESSKNRTKTHKGFVKEVNNLVGGKYSVLGSYSGALEPIKMRHNVCGFEWKILPNNFLSVGNRCPKCSDQIYSQGERRIREFLEENNIEHERQYTFNGCRHRNKLRFDFAIFSKENNNTLFDRWVDKVIEYHGKQHYEVIEHFGGKEDFEERKKRDRIKEDYCKKHNIPMLVISYKKKDKIEKILTDKIL